ncbi:MAG TPA: sterol desaturase family protein [Anaeromyxobacteraceae bacterium]|nr:sterol desaturase family protein [Anaeromyxobacteraceae bacterium]
MFWLEPHQTPRTPQRGSPRMFRVDWVERYLSRVHPAQVLVVWVPVALFFVARSLRNPTLGLPSTLSLVFFGILIWTLLEYVLHRFVFHFEPDPDSELEGDIAFLVHGVHHDYPHDPDRLVMPPVVAIVLAFLIGLPLRVLLGARLFPGAFAGLVAGYIWYDMTHYAVHHMRPRTGLGKLQRKGHLLHHFAEPEARFGVTTPLWDLCFGTYRSPKAEGAADRADARKA